MSSPDAATPDTDRRSRVLDSAMATFARFGYRKTSMEEVARAADISRPGLYFLFSSKESLFRAAATRTLEQDLDAIEHTLADTDRPLSDRLVDAFDRWTGRYIGPLAGDIAAAIEDNPHVLGEITETAPRRFEELITDAITHGSTHESARKPVAPAAVAQTLISTSIGLKQQARTREFYVARMRTAVSLLVH
ncbi:TetR/AcrR family transcriptional regulator [Streptomyces sp. BH097]|uniref:TetR/AcrR family transcriptional regulator n=1 Tax=unclassified Streptomyces TaxID=2593676 RepID=UPI003BB815D1